MRSRSGYEALGGVRALEELLSGQSAPVVLVECSAIYLPVLPDHGVRVRLRISQETHRALLERGLSLSAQQADLLCDFPREIEIRNLAASFVHLESTAVELERRLADAVIQSCSH